MTYNDVTFVLIITSFQVPSHAKSKNLSMYRKNIALRIYNNTRNEVEDKGTWKFIHILWIRQNSVYVFLEARQVILMLFIYNIIRVHTSSINAYVPFISNKIRIIFRFIIYNWKLLLKEFGSINLGTRWGKWYSI